MLLTKAEKVDRRSAVDRKVSKPRHWHKKEDELLRAAVEKYGNKHWKKIAELVPGRNHTQCLQRWSKVLAPGLKKGQWSASEDQLLAKLANGQLESCKILNLPERFNWGVISKLIPGRTPKQCRERWVSNLNPEIRKGEWTPEEDARILELNGRYPFKWATIAKNLPGRTENAVKIRYKSLSRTRKRQRESLDVMNQDRAASPSLSSRIVHSKPSKKETQSIVDIIDQYQLPCDFQINDSIIDVAYKRCGTPELLKMESSRTPSSIGYKSLSLRTRTNVMTAKPRKVSKAGKLIAKFRGAETWPRHYFITEMGEIVSFPFAQAHPIGQSEMNLSGQQFTVSVNLKDVNITKSDLIHVYTEFTLFDEEISLKTGTIMKNEELKRMLRTSNNPDKPWIKYTTVKTNPNASDLELEFAFEPLHGRWIYGQRFEDCKKESSSGRHCLRAYIMLSFATAEEYSQSIKLEFKNPELPE